MKRLATVAACAWSVVTLAPVHAQVAGVSTSLVLNRTRFLSTQTAQAALTIVNHSQVPVFFGKCGVVFYVWERSHWVLRVACPTIAHSPPASRIEPSKRYVTSIDLPPCPVYSDPCTENVRVKYAIGAGKTSQWYTADLPPYEFVPDPSATYDIPGLSHNRPVFITPGVARDTVLPDTMLFQFTASKSEPQGPFTAQPPLISQIQQAFTSAGVAAVGSGFETTDDSWKADIYVGNASSQHDVISKALQQVTAQFRGRISAVAQHINFDPYADAPAVYQSASDQAERLARSLSAMTGAGDIRFPSFSRSLPRTYLGNQATTVPFPDLTRGIQQPQGIVLDQAPASPTPIEVIVEGLYLGTKPADLDRHPAIVKTAASAFRPPDSWFLPPLDAQAIVTADRPEIYVTGTASVHAAVADALQPFFAAALSARQRTKYLANILGVRPGQQSLFAVYPMGEDSDLRTIGVATTFSGGDMQRWTRIAADPRLHSYRMDDSRQRAMVPIAVPDDATTLTEMAAATPAFARDALRFDVEFVNKADARGRVAQPNSIVTQLKRRPDVIDAAVDVETDIYTRSRYEIVMRGASRTDLMAVFTALRSAYAAVQPRVRFRVQGLVLNCPALENRLLQASIRQDWIQAGADARTTHRVLRKLLLASTFPVDEQGACNLRATPPDGLGYMQPNEVPQVPATSHVFLTSMLVFRTFPPR